LTARVLNVFIWSKQKVQDKFDRLEYSDDNIISEGFLISEDMS